MARDDLSKAQRFVQLNSGLRRNDKRRDPHDFHPTPPEATRALLKVEKFGGPIWEPACGEGHISEVLLEAGYDVYSSDLVDRGYGDPGLDFLRVVGSTDEDEPDIVTNPPYGALLAQFIRKACTLARGKVALLQRVATLEGRERAHLYRKHGLRRVWVISNRINFDPTPGARSQGGAIGFAWFIYEPRAKKAWPPTIDFIEADTPVSRRRVRFR